MATSITTKGPFTAGTVVDFYFSFSDLDGILYDPSNIEVIVYDADDTEVESFDAIEKLADGYYLLVWHIPSDLNSGLYTIQVSYTVEDAGGPETRTLTESFVIGEQQQSFLAPQTLAFRAALEHRLDYAQRIPVYDEIGRFNRERTIAEFSFPRWNQPSGVKVLLDNGDRVRESAYEVDYLNGKIEFLISLSSADEVHAHYTFRWFTDDQLDSFVTDAVQIFNQYPPHSAYLITNLPLRYGITVVQQAAVFGLRKLLFDFTWQTPTKVIGSIDRANEILASWERLKQNYETELKDLYTQKKYQPYVGQFRTVTVPSFQLPGGRATFFRSLFKSGPL